MDRSGRSDGDANAADGLGRGAGAPRPAGEVIGRVLLVVGLLAMLVVIVIVTRALG